MLQLLQEAKAAVIPAHHVLFDTWFCSPSIAPEDSRPCLRGSRHGKEDGKDTLSPSQRYLQDVKAIYKQHRKRRGRSKYLLHVEATFVKGEESLPVSLVFVRNRNKSERLAGIGDDGYEPHGGRSHPQLWQALGHRGVLQGMRKSFLRLEKDCRSLSYDAMTAHVSIVFTRYMFIAVEQRECKDARSLVGAVLSIRG